MKKINFAEWLIVILTIFFVVYNTIYGWNEQPINSSEKACDTIFTLGLYLAWFIFLLPILDLYKYHVKKVEDETKNN